MSLQIHTASRFIDTVVSTPNVNNDFVSGSPGVLFDLRVEKLAHQRYIWLAAGAYFQFDEDDHWWVVGKLNFYLEGTQVGVMPFTDASAEMLDAERVAAPRVLTRIRPDGTGSTQPVLRYQSNNSTVGTPFFRDNLDIPAFSLRLEVDRIEYVLEKSYCNNQGGSFMGFLNGIQVISSL